MVVAHPVAESLGQTAALTAIEACRRRGDQVEVIDLYGEDFDPVLTLAEWQAHADPTFTRTHHGGHVRALEWATSLVLVYPTWFGGPPAMLKGWFDRVWSAGVAYDLPSGGGPIRPRLRGIRDITVVTTHGSKKWMNSLQGEPGKRLTGRGLRVLASRRCRRHWIALYGVDMVSNEERVEFLNRVRARFS